MADYLSTDPNAGADYISTDPHVGVPADENLAGVRDRLATELQDPGTAYRLYSLTHQEVGNQGPAAQQAFIETVFNRAAARGATIAQTVADRNYYPAVSLKPAAMGENEMTRYRDMAANAWQGSNLANYATGNASGSVGFAGGPQTFKAGGERFGIEGPDKNWIPRARAADVQELPVEKAIPVTPVEMEVRRAQPVEQSGTHPPLGGYISTDPDAGLIDQGAPGLGYAPGPYPRAIPVTPQGVIQPSVTEEVSAQPQPEAAPAAPESHPFLDLVHKGLELARTPSPAWMQPIEKALTSPLPGAKDVAEAAIAANPITAPYYWLGKAAPETVPGKLSSGFTEGLRDVGAGFSSPANLMLLATGVGETALAGRLVAGGFFAQAASQFPEEWKQLNETDDLATKAKLLTTMAAGLGLPLLGLKGAKGEANIEALSKGEAPTTGAGEFGFKDITVPGAEPAAAPEAVAPAPEAPAPLAEAPAGAEPPMAQAGGGATAPVTTTEAAVQQLMADGMPEEQARAAVAAPPQPQVPTPAEPLPSTGPAPETPAQAVPAPAPGPPAEPPGSAWNRIAFLDQERIKGQLAQLGYEPAQIENMTRSELAATDDARAALTAQPPPDLEPAMPAADFLDAPENVAPYKPKAQRPLTKAELAEREHQAELLRQGRADIEAQGGMDLLDAIKQSGGLPGLGHEWGKPYKGELQNLRDTIRGTKGVRYRDVFSAKPQVNPDELLLRLRARGFDIETPHQLIDAIQNRVRTGTPHYGMAELGQALYGEPGVAETPAKYGEQISKGEAPAAPLRSYIGHITDTGAIEAQPYYREHPTSHEKLRYQGTRWRYQSENEAVVWWDRPSKQQKEAVTQFIERKGGRVSEHYSMSPSTGMMTRVAEAPGTFSLAPPETLAEQKAREAQERAANQARAVEAEKKAQVKYGWQQKITGTSGDLGQADIFGGGDLFAQARPSAEYESARQTASAATRKFAGAQELYRMGQISDQEFLAAKAEHDAAQSDFDKAFSAEQNRPPPEPIPPPAPRGEQLRLLETPNEQQVASHVDRQGVRPENKADATQTLNGTLALAKEPALQKLYQPELFREARAGAAPEPGRRPGPVLRGAEAARAGFYNVQLGRGRLTGEILAANKNRISIVLPELVKGNIPGFDLVGKTILAPVDFAQAVQTIRSPYQESLKVVLTARGTGRVLASEIVHVGTLGESIAHPRDIMRQFSLLKEKHPNAELWISHNHPSGDPAPSNADIVLHDVLKAAAKTIGVNLRDHVITDGKQYYSIETGSFGELPAPVKQPWEVLPQVEMPKIQSPGDWQVMAAGLRNDAPDAAHIFYVGTRHNLVGVERVVDAHPNNLRAAIAAGIPREGARGILVDLPEGAGRNDLYNLEQATLALRGTLLDVSWPGMPSAEARGMISRTSSEVPYTGARELPTQRAMEEAAASGDGEKMRGHIATVQRMTEVSPDVKARVESWYQPTTLEGLHQEANATIDKLGLGPAQDLFLKSRKATPDMMALGHNLALRLDSLGRYEEAAMVRDGMAERLTTPAQSLWFISTIGKTSPEGLIRTAQKLVTDVIASDPEKVKLLADINRLKAQLAAMPEGKGRDAATAIVIKQLAKVNRPGQRLTPAQLDNLLQKHEQGQLGPADLQQTLTKYFKIPQLTPENVAKIKAAQKAWADVPADNPILKLKRAGDMMDAVYSQVPKTWWDKVRATAVISMILHGRLPIRIGISNAVRMFGQMTVDAIQNVPRDIGNVFTGKKTITGEQLASIASGLAEPVRAYRAGYSDAKLRGLTTVKSFHEGVRTLLDLANLTTRGLYEASDITRGTHTFSSRFGRFWEDAVTLIHNVVPYGFWTAAFKSSLARQMRVADVTVPTAEMIANAQLDGNKAIFYNDTALYKGLMAVRKTLDMPTATITKGKYGLGTALIPFAKVPAAVLTEGATWTPFGLTKAGWEILRPYVTGGENFRAKEAGDAVVKAALGTGGAMLAGYQLAKIGVLTGAPDENKEIEAMRKAAGWGGFRINLSELKRRALSGNWWAKSHTPADGDLITNYNWLEPVAFTVAMGADIAHSQDKREIDLKRGKITSNAAFSAVGAGIQSITENPMLQNVQHLMSAVGEGNWGRAAADIFGNVPGNFVPALVRQTSQYIDNTVRETRGGTYVTQELSRLATQIPGLSQKYPPRYDVFGEAIDRYNYANNSLLNVFFNPAMVSKFKNDPQLAEMQRIYETTGSSEALHKQVPATLMINGKQVQLTNEQVAAYQRYVGKESSAVITRLLASPAFAAEPLQVKQQVMGQVLGAVNNAAKVDLFGQSPVQVGVGLKGPTVRGPGVLEVGSLLEARQAGYNRPPGGQPAGPNLPAWQLTPPPALPSLAP